MLLPSRHPGAWSLSFVLWRDLPAIPVLGAFHSFCGVISVRFALVIVPLQDRPPVPARTEQGRAVFLFSGSGRVYERACER